LNATYLDVVGPLARSGRDAALALDVLAGPTQEDLATYAAIDRIPDGGYAAALGDATIAGRRFGLVGPGWRTDRFPLDTATERHYRAAAHLVEALGGEVVEDPFAGSGTTAVVAEREGRRWMAADADARYVGVARKRLEEMGA